MGGPQILAGSPRVLRCVFNVDVATLERNAHFCSLSWLSRAISPSSPPRRFQDASKTSKMPPRRPQDASKTRPRRPQDVPKRPKLLIMIIILSNSNNTNNDDNNATKKKHKNNDNTNKDTREEASDLCFTMVFEHFMFRIFIVLRSLQESPKRPKTPHDAPRRPPRRLQDALKSFQDA